MESPVVDHLDSNLETRLSPHGRLILAKALLGGEPAQEFEIGGRNKGSTAKLDAYFTYYYQQCDLIGLHNRGRFSSLKTHQDVASVARLLREPGQKRERVLEQLAEMLPGGTADQHEQTLKLTTRLVTMMQIGTMPHELRGGRHIEWTGDALEDFVDTHFSDAPVLGHERIKFEKEFNALSLSRIAGLEVRWTDNLADHLRLVNDDRVVRVFHHATFLRSQESGNLFPPNFISETLRTLALLFPKYDKQLRKLYGIQVARHGLDPEMIESGHLIADERQVEGFSYWHDRLVVLKQVYDESRPRTISQWWHDRRNGVQWYTFWVAILVLSLTVFFGLVQSIEGALQVYAAFHPAV